MERVKGIEPCLPDGLRRMVKVTKYLFHSFRHTLTSPAINHGAIIRIVQNLLGHTDAIMTSHYAHISMQSKQQVLNMLPVFSMDPEQQLVRQTPSFAEIFTGVVAAAGMIPFTCEGNPTIGPQF